MEGIILAGGFGTRLRARVPDIPKPLAPVAGPPFLCWLLDRLAQEGFHRIILSVGYGGTAIREALGSRHGNIELVYAVEDQPLGTGGGRPPPRKISRPPFPPGLGGEGETNSVVPS